MPHHTKRLLLEPQARAFVRHLHKSTGGRPMQWRMLHEMPTTAEVVFLAVQLGWCVVQGEYSVCLTEEGRAIAATDRADLRSVPQLLQSMRLLRKPRR